MAEATSSIAQFPTIRITTAARVLAMLRARQAVKRELQAQGLKVTQYSAAEITSWARCFLDDHPELIPAAREEARRMILSGAMGKRARAKLLNFDQTQKA
jgi:hypothetical protein